jgi:hypothetical protein
VNLGHWDKAIIKSIFYTAFLVLLYAAYEIGIPSNLDSIAGFGMLSLIFLGAYLLISIVGWLFIGFPVHWLICKYSNGNYLFYIFVALTFTLALYYWFSVLEIAIVYGSFALVQALIFRYYAYK